MLADLTETLAYAGVNVEALAAYGVGEEGYVRLVVVRRSHHEANTPQGRPGRYRAKDPHHDHLPRARFAGPDDPPARQLRRSTSTPSISSTRPATVWNWPSQSPIPKQPGNTSKLREASTWPAGSVHSSLVHRPPAAPRCRHPRPDLLLRAKPPRRPPRRLPLPPPTTSTSVAPTTTSSAPPPRFRHPPLPSTDCPPKTRPISTAGSSPSRSTTTGTLDPNRESTWPTPCMSCPSRPASPASSPCSTTTTPIT